VQARRQVPRTDGEGALLATSADSSSRAGMLDGRSTRKGARTHDLVGALAIAGVALTLMLFMGFKAWEFVNHIEDEDGDGDVDVKDVGHKLRRLFCFNLSPDAIRDVSKFMVVAAVGLYLLIAAGIAQSIERQLLLYGFFLFLALGLIGIVAQEIFGDLVAMQKKLTQGIQGVQRFFTQGASPDIKQVFHLDPAEASLNKAGVGATKK